ncbi:MAG: histidine phosphatase family protein [Nakamurella sp.]
MRLVIVRHGETEWSLSGRHTGTTDLALTANGRREAVALSPVLHSVLHGQCSAVVSSPRRRATETAALALPEHPASVDPLIAEFNYGDFEGLTTKAIRSLLPDWDIWRDGCPGGESIADAGRRADEFLRTYSQGDSWPVVVFTHGHFSRILAARALGLAPECGRLFATATASVSVIKDDRGERCIGLWNASPALLDDTTGVTDHLGTPGLDPLPPVVN